MLSDSEITPAVEAFAETARRFCSWAESPFGEPRGEMLTARKLLAELHRAAIELPDLGPGEEAEAVIPAELWALVRGRFLMLPLDGYWDVFNPLKEEAPVFNSLLDDLTDIYRNLKEGALLYTRGLVVEAVWEWRFTFEIHWGAHLTGAQRAIHAYFSDEA